MSTQPTLAEFVKTEPDEREEDVDEVRPEFRWGPGTRARRCDNCEAHVPPGLARGLRDAEGRIHACPECTSQSDAVNGASAGADVEISSSHIHGGGF